MKSLSPCKIVIHDYHNLLGETAGWREFQNPIGVIQAMSLPDVSDALRRVEEASKEGYIAIGFITYDASPSFDSAIYTHQGGEIPLIWFALYNKCQSCALPSSVDMGSFSVSPWSRNITRERYAYDIQKIKEMIGRGDTYQVNHTFRLHADFQGDPWMFFLNLQNARQSKYSAYLDLGDHVILSVSPELFLLRQGMKLTCHPMKGTVGRGLSSRDDLANAEWLRTSEKNRAENVMIVDMMRSDLGKIAAIGSVKVESLFDVERYATLWQMTSAITAESDASLFETIAALFPCASVTGAPKVQACRIIAEMESTPRGVYTGCIGIVAPGGDAQFNVAIRTVHLNRREGRMTYGTGGGITWDSDANEEYKECRTKTMALMADSPPFQLLETILWKPVSGYFLLERHLRRLADSALYFDIPLDIVKLKVYLLMMACQFPPIRQRVRLLVEKEGAFHAEAQTLSYAAGRRMVVVLAKRPISLDNRFLYHKTTMREPYRLARQDSSQADDVLLWNIKREITETTIGNVVVRKNGALFTPPIVCGLLPGVYREHLLENDRITERIISLEDVWCADAIYMVNSVRGWMPIDKQVLLRSSHRMGEWDGVSQEKQ